MGVKQEKQNILKETPKSNGLWAIQKNQNYQMY